MKAADVHSTLSRLKGYQGVYVKEFTWWVALDTAAKAGLDKKLDQDPASDKRQLRIDSILIDTTKRHVFGYEVKVDLYDWRRDRKWQLYSQFCTHLSVACPLGLIDETEVPPGYGLLWINKNGGEEWIRRPDRLKKDPSLWKDTYLRILEQELPRLHTELRMAKAGKYKNNQL